MPFLSVVIPAYNEAPRLPLAYESLRRALTEAGLTDWECVVCDNNSTDGTAEVARALGARVVFEPHNQISRARNRGAAEARGEWLLFFDADTEATPGLMRAMRAAMGPGVCGGGALIEFDGPIGPLGGFLHRLWNGVSRALSLAAGCFIFCRRQAWADVGGFDEKFYASEEVWFSSALARWGKKRGQEFVILRAARVVTSARKFSMYGPWQLARLTLPLFFPGALRSRRFCDLWYKKRG